MFWRALSLRSKLLILTLTGLVLFGVFSYAQVIRSFEIRQRSAKTDLRSKAMMATQSLAGAFHERYMDIQAFAANAVFAGQNKEAMIQTLNNYVEGYKAYDAIVFVDAEGKFVAANSKNFEGKPIDTKNLETRSFAETPWFQRSIKNEFFEDKAKGLTGSVVEDMQIDPLTSALTASTQYGLSFSRAVLNSDGRPVGVLTARASLRFMESELRGTFDILQSSGLRSGQIYLMNKDGLLMTELTSSTVTERSELRRNADKIMRWNLATQQGQMAASEAVSGRSGALIEADRVERVERVWGYSPITDKRFLDQLGWSVVISASSDEIFADLFFQRRWFFIGFLVLATLSGLFGYGIARNVAREFLDYSHKLKDECERLVEIGDGLDGVLHRAVHSNSESNSNIGLAAGTAKEIFTQAEDCSESLKEISKRSRDNSNKALVGEHSLQRIAVEMMIARSSAEQLSAFEREMKEINSKIEAFSEVIFKAQLLGYNASIEANRAGTSGKGFANIAQEIEALTESAGAIHRDLSDSLNRSQAKALELVSGVRRSVNDSESLMNEAKVNVSQMQAEFASMSESIEAVRIAMEAKEDALKKIFETVVQLDDSAGRSQSNYVELSRGLNDLREQGERLDEVIQDLSSTIKGQKGRVRSRRSVSSHMSSSSARRQGDYSQGLARADVVDRLAQKMRPRLVVKTDDAEPEVNDVAPDHQDSRRVG